MPWCSKNVRIRMMIKQMEDSEEWAVIKVKHDDDSLQENVESLLEIFYPSRFKSEFNKYSLGDTDFYCLKLSDRVSRDDIDAFLED